MMWTGLFAVITYAIIYALGMADVDPGDWMWFAAWAVFAICGAIKDASNFFKARADMATPGSDGHLLLLGSMKACANAAELLKAQEPRVMTLEEVQQHNNQDGCVWFEQPTYNAVAAFVRKEEFEIEVISPYILGEPINHGYWLNSNYNVTWRCWTSRPTDEQREATPWN